MRNRLVSDVAARKYPDSASPISNAGQLTPGEIKVSEPDALAPFHKAPPQEKSRRVRDVLQWAHCIYKRGGVTMLDAINAASDGSATGEYAKISLRRILLELNLAAWESHPTRTRRDVHALFRKAIGRLTPHRGGWTVSREVDQ